MKRNKVVMMLGMFSVTFSLVCNSFYVYGAEERTVGISETKQEESIFGNIQRSALMTLLWMLSLDTPRAKPLPEQTMNDMYPHRYNQQGMYPKHVKWSKNRKYDLKKLR